MKKTMAVLLALALLFATSSLALASEEYPEHIHMEVANWEANTSGTPKPWEKLENEKFNMDVTWRAEDWGNYQDVIALWGASDELPDVFCGYIDETWFGDFISQQLIRDIPMETLKQYPNLYAVWEMDVAYLHAGWHDLWRSVYQRNPFRGRRPEWMVQQKVLRRAWNDGAEDTGRVLRRDG